MRIPGSTIEKIKDAVRIEEIVGQYVTLTYRNGRYWGLCPFHQETDGSFSVTPDKGLFYCFGCHKGGTVFDFIMEIENCNFPESVEILAKKTGITLELERGDSSAMPKRHLSELYGRVATSFHYILKNKEEAQPARKYLSERGISEKTIDTFQIGWAPRDRYWLWKFLKGKSFSDDFLRLSGLFSKKYEKAAFFSNRITFPISTAQGDVIGFGGRILQGNGPKYINSSESEIFKKGENLYGLDKALSAARKEGKIVLVEGYTDVLALHEAGIEYAVAPLGTAFTPKQARLLKRYGGKVYIMFDGDSAGVAAAKKTAYILEDASIEAMIVEIPGNGDPSELLQTNGGKSLHNLLKYPISIFDYLYKKTSEEFSTENAEGKDAVARELYHYFKHITSEVKKEGLLRELSERLGVDLNAVVNDFYRESRGGGRDSSSARKEAPRESAERRNFSKELYLMIAVAINHDYFTGVRSAIQVDDLEDAEAKAVYIALEECYRNESLSIECVLQKINDSSTKQRILEGSATGEFAFAVDELVRDGIKTIKQKSFERQRRKITDMIKKAERSGDQDNRLNDLLSEKMHLDKELENLRVTNNVKSAD